MDCKDIGTVAPELATGWTLRKFMVVALCFLLNMLDGADILVVSFIAPVLSAEWSIAPERLGLLFSASLAGMAIGCLVVAPMGDRVGRRRMIIVALAGVTIAMTASSVATDLISLGVARLIVGIGVGTIGVSMTALTAEYAPAHHADFAVSFVQAGWPLAAVGTAFAAVRVIDVYGWRAVLLGVGLVSAMILLLVAILLPETSALSDRAEEMKSPAPRSVLTGFRELFAPGRAGSSIVLWIAVMLVYFVLYFVISWIPKLAVQAGLSTENAIYAGATYNLGAFVGTMMVGLIAISRQLDGVIAATLGFAAAAMIGFGNVNAGAGVTLVLAFVVGLTVQGGFNGFWALAANLYPAGFRSTGIGWALGVGRIGAILGPIVGGLLVGAGVSVGVLFLIYAIPLVTASLLVMVLQGRDQFDRS